MDMRTAYEFGYDSGLRVQNSCVDACVGIRIAYESDDDPGLRVQNSRTDLTVYNGKHLRSR